jgi:7-carboxy-7-deazaguanine synthase (Cx14CxxC type)
MTYAVKEIFLTVQGEGVRAGTVSVFLRFAGCNLWSGLEKDRASAICKFCDTDFVKTDGENGGKYSAAELSEKVRSLWQGEGDMIGDPWVVCTGGEPLLQLDTPLIDAIHACGFKIAVETNGTIAAPNGIDWLCVSPKANAELVQMSGDELKLVFPQDENIPSDFTHLNFTNFCLQPRDDSYLGTEKKETHSDAAFQYCLENPIWRLSVQTHKSIGVP